MAVVASEYCFYDSKRVCFAGTESGLAKFVF
jgi:hypothetical protein